MTASLAIWFLIDTGFSIVVGQWEHALFNVAFALVIGVPLAAMWRDLSDPHPTRP